jgi:hypothetical protein
VVEYHPYKDSTNPRTDNACERCGRVRLHETHLSLLDRAVALRELYLAEEIGVERFAENLLDWRGESKPSECDGSNLIWRLLGFLTELQLGECDEVEVRIKIAETR